MFLILYMYIDMWDYVSVCFGFLLTHVLKREIWVFFNYFPVIYDACFGSRSPVPKISWTPGMGNNIVHYYPAYIYIYTYMYTFPNIGPGIIPFNISDPINMWDIFVG